VGEIYSIEQKFDDSNNPSTQISCSFLGQSVEILLHGVHVTRSLQGLYVTRSLQVTTRNLILEKSNSRHDLSIGKSKKLAFASSNFRQEQPKKVEVLGFIQLMFLYFPLSIVTKFA
jgi:hypothetical protein